MIKPEPRPAPQKTKVMHFRCPLDLVKLIEADGSNASATIIRRLLWSYDEAKNAPDMYKLGLAAGVRAMGPLHAAVADMVRRQAVQVLAEVRAGHDVADATRRASYLRLKLPQSAGSPRGGHLPVDDPWPVEEHDPEDELEPYKGLTDGDPAVVDQAIPDPVL